MQTEYQAMVEALMEPERSGISYIPYGTREWLKTVSRLPRDKRRLTKVDRYKMGFAEI